MQSIHNVSSFETLDSKINDTRQTIPKKNTLDRDTRAPKPWNGSSMRDDESGVAHPGY